MALREWESSRARLLDAGWPETTEELEAALLLYGFRHWETGEPEPVGRALIMLSADPDGEPGVIVNLKTLMVSEIDGEDIRNRQCVSLADVLTMAVMTRRRQEEATPEGVR